MERRPRRPGDIVLWDGGLFVLCYMQDMTAPPSIRQSWEDRTRRLDRDLVAGLANFHASGGTKHTLDVTIDSDCKEC